MSIDIDFQGPLFDGRARRAMEAACNEGRDDIAEFGEQAVLARTGQYFQHSTGYYESRIATTRVSADTSLVHDNGVVYGPWLAGTGSRNAPATRFAGYSHWREAKQLVAARGPGMADQAVRRRLPEMGG